MTFHNYSIAPPATWQDFEKLCHFLWMDLLNDSNIQLNGRQGQAQSGVDVYGRNSSNGIFTCIQCKGKNQNYGNVVTEAELRREVDKAKTFMPIPGVFILATTAPNDQNIQKAARLISESHRKAGLFEVCVLGWDDLCQRISNSPRTIEVFYPQHSPVQANFIKTATENLLEINKKLDVVLPAKSVPIDISLIEKSFRVCSAGLLDWPKTLQVNNQWIYREEEENILAKIHSAYHSTTVLLGEPGTGKSAVLSKIGQSLMDSKKTVIAIKADQVDGTVIDFSTLSEAIDLPDAIDKCIIQVSQLKIVYLLIDQLDALSELIDVKTNRLSVLLNLVKKLSNTPNIHIILSSRPFEYKHDHRLSSLTTEKIILPNLNWVEVEQILMDNNIKIENSTDNFKDFLCRPNNLNFYLKYIQTNSEKIFTSHIDLYEHIWNNSLGQNELKEKRRVCMLRAATEMTNDAKQILPVARYDNYSLEIDWLCGSGLLIKHNNGKSFSFAHQTLQAFVWTRSFIQDNQSLIEFVLKHQDNLNIRPKLSTVIFYLREADPAEYEKQVKLLFGANFVKLRKHVQFLLIDCIGSQLEPTKTEINALLPQFSADSGFFARVCKSIEGKRKWFEVIKDSHVSSIMKRNDIYRYNIADVLASVIDHYEDAIITLLNNHWKNKDNITYLYETLKNINTWSHQILLLANYIAEQDNIDEYFIKNLADVISKSNIDSAISFVAHAFNIKFQKIIKESTFEDSVRAKIQKLLIFDTRWYELHKIAEASPKYFIDCFWSFLKNGAENTKFVYASQGNSYCECFGNWFSLSEENDISKKYFSVALEKAITLFAKTQSSEFIDFVDNNKSIELMPVQRLLAKGLEAIVERNASFVLNYLLEDSRRFMLGGSINNKYATTTNLLTSMFEHLNQEERVQLEKAIRTFKAFSVLSGDSPETKKNLLRKNRQVVFILIKSIPTDHISQSSRNFLVGEEKVLGSSIDRYTTTIRGGLIAQTSPMSIDQIIKAKNEDILNCFKEFTDNKSERLDDDKYVGSTEFARTFEKFSEQYPERATEIILKLTPKNLDAVTHGLEGISKSGNELDALLELIVKLEMTGFNSPSFYEDVARSLQNKIVFPYGLSDDFCIKLESWLVINKDDFASQTLSEEKYDIEKPSSVLWGFGRYGVVPRGNYSVISALIAGYINSNVPNFSRVLQFLKEHITRGDNIHMWLILLSNYFPKILYQCEQREAEELIDLFIEHYNEVLTTPQFATCLAWAFHWASPSKLNEWMNLIKLKNTHFANHIFGELLGIRFAIHSNDSWVRDQMSQLICNANNISLLSGLAYSLENIWCDSKSISTPYIIELINMGNPIISSILLRIIGHKDYVEVCSETESILDAFISKNTLMNIHERGMGIAKTLSALTVSYPAKVVKLSTQIIDSHGRELANVQTAAHVETSDLITIAITLHNIGPSFQATGLDLFERLLDIDVYEVRRVLQNIDGLPKVSYARN